MAYVPYQGTQLLTRAGIDHSDLPRRPASRHASVAQSAAAGAVIVVPEDGAAGVARRRQPDRPLTEPSRPQARRASAPPGANPARADPGTESSGGSRTLAGCHGVTAPVDAGQSGDCNHQRRPTWSRSAKRWAGWRRSCRSRISDAPWCPTPLAARPSQSAGAWFSRRCSRDSARCRLQEPDRYLRQIDNPDVGEFAIAHQCELGHELPASTRLPQPRANTGRSDWLLELLICSVIARGPRTTDCPA